MQAKQQPQQQQFERIQVEGDQRLRHHPVVTQFKHQPLQVIHQLPNQHHVVPDEQVELLRMENKRHKPLEEPLLVFPEEQVPQEQEFEHDEDDEDEDEDEEEEEEPNLEGVFVHQASGEAKQRPQDEIKEGNLEGIIPVVNPTRSAPSVPPRSLVDAVDNVESSNQPSTMKPTSVEATQQPRKRKADRKSPLIVQL